MACFIQLRVTVAECCVAAESEAGRLAVLRVPMPLDPVARLDKGVSQDLLRVLQFPLSLPGFAQMTAFGMKRPVLRLLGHVHNKSYVWRRHASQARRPAVVLRAPVPMPVVSAT